MSKENGPWWESAVVYQIYPRSFADTSGSGVGDLRGVIGRMEHLAWLGIDAIWLSPFYRSPMHDHGYDISDYCDVDPSFGTLADFDALVASAHDHGIRVILDWVAAHTSTDHAWFQEARRSREDAKRDWYVWRDPVPGPDGTPQPPNNWVSDLTDGGPAWTFDETTGQSYLHSFLPEQADLNWENPEVAEAMHDVLRFWLNRGVDGFRSDVINNIAKDPELADVAPASAKLPHVLLNDVPEVHPLLRGIRNVLDAAPPIPLANRPDDRGGRMMVGEVMLLSTEQVSRYFGNDDELHLSFNFAPLFAPWTADVWRSCIEKTESLLAPIDAWPTWVLSNHDGPRHRTRNWKGDGPASEARARAAAVMLLTLRGTPFLYMGEELGLEDAVVPPEQQVDPGGYRDGCRAPLPWDGNAGHGWAGAEPWLLFPPDADTRNAESLRADPGSILHLYRRLLELRRETPALQRGELALLEAPEGVLAYRRSLGDDSRVVLVNFTSDPISISATGELGGVVRNLQVELTSDSDDSSTHSKRLLRADQAVILR